MAEKAAHSPENAHSQYGHPDSYYLKVWGVLLVLLVVSVTGPLVGIPVLTLITAFGIALVKAYLVAKEFMHLELEPRYVVYAFVTCIALSLLFFAGTAPDVMRHRGQHWENLAAQAEVERAKLGVAVPAAPAPAAPVTPMTPEVAFATICASCHGAEGDGTGPAAMALTPKPANFQSADFWLSRDRDRIAKVIREGGSSVGRSALMPAFGAQLNEETALGLADYLRTRFQPKAPSP